MTYQYSANDFDSLLKYPRTPHLEGSRLQPGDEGHGHVPYASLKGCWLVVEEKLDGANCGVSFSEAGDLLLQSRGHYLVGGGRERQFNLFKRWASAHEAVLLERLEDRYVMYGEWLHKKHSVFYDALPHYFTEFDVWDRKTQQFLSTRARRALLTGLPVLSVPVLYEGVAPDNLKGLLRHLGASLGRTEQWPVHYEAAAASAGLDKAQAWQLADKNFRCEGLYLKIEEGEETTGRLKWVRSDFVQAIVQSGKHHAEQPFVANRLIEGVDIFSPVLTHGWEAARSS